MKAFMEMTNIASKSHKYNLCKSVSLIYLVFTVASIPFECQRKGGRGG